MALTLKYIPAADSTVDAEWTILQDGIETDVAIQDCRAYGGGYAVNRYGGEGDALFAEYIGTAKTLLAATAIAAAAIRASSSD